MAFKDAIPDYDGLAAIIGISEKGYVDLKLKVSGDGGHSSMPPHHTAVGILSEAITRLEAHPFPADFRFLTSEGKDRLEGNHTRPNWVSLGGKLDDQHASVAIFGHPGNFRSPQPVRLHPAKPYFCFTPAAIDRFTIKPGAPYVSQYRFLVKAGAIDAEEINAHWLRYAGGAKNAK